MNGIYALKMSGEHLPPSGAYKIGCSVNIEKRTGKLIKTWEDLGFECDLSESLAIVLSDEDKARRAEGYFHYALEPYRLKLPREFEQVDGHTEFFCDNLDGETVSSALEGFASTLKEKKRIEEIVSLDKLVKEKAKPKKKATDSFVRCVSSGEYVSPFETKVQQTVRDWFRDSSLEMRRLCAQGEEKNLNRYFKDRLSTFPYNIISWSCDSSLPRVERTMEFREYSLVEYIESFDRFSCSNIGWKLEKQEQVYRFLFLSMFLGDNTFSSFGIGTFPPELCHDRETFVVSFPELGLSDFLRVFVMMDFPEGEPPGVVEHHICRFFGLSSHSDLVVRAHERYPSFKEYVKARLGSHNLVPATAPDDEEDGYEAFKMYELGVLFKVLFANSCVTYTKSKEETVVSIKPVEKTVWNWLDKKKEK
jgi:hypothetical protein